MGFSGTGLTAAEVLAEINKYLTNSTNKITDARALALDKLDLAISDVAALNYPVFVWNTVLADSFRGRVGTWAEVTHTNFWLGVIAGNAGSSAQNDEISLGNLFIPETTAYTAYLVFEGNTDKGIAHIMLNGSDEGTIDMYNGGGLDANMMGSTSLGTLTAGHYACTVKVVTKNGSSSNYLCLLQAALIAKT